ncbi:hypothetical protein LF1_17470 [Rubripirellula obstinata]|uniref:BON domain-containing protein n=1 Tax=Rubripirellula obstinata TaxID=406547 RepID=A0A5B1CDH7_9BACT|nr:hypothetical protein [Rubripirellula obstinata]KAA1259218.1 hypothetical protein LF1_17470 [Rubripirellula obstinata]
MTVIECEKRDRRTREKILTIFRGDASLRDHVELIEIEIEHSRIVLSGELPNGQLVQQLVPAIRRAGVLCQIAVNIEVAA